MSHKLVQNRIVEKTGKRMLLMPGVSSQTRIL